MAFSAKKKREQARKNTQKRMERLAAAKQKGIHTSLEWELLKAVFGEYTCVKCGSDEYKVQKDHINPISNGGSDGIDNIQPLCGPCNISKGAAHYDWRAKRRPDWSDAFVSLLDHVRNAGCQNG